MPGVVKSLSCRCWRLPTINCQLLFYNECIVQSVRIPLFACNAPSPFGSDWDMLPRRPCCLAQAKPTLSACMYVFIEVVIGCHSRSAAMVVIAHSRKG
jgi:hypothetical protein